MAKSKTTEKTIEATENVEAAMKNGAEALKTGFEKAVKNYDHFVGFGKDTVEAYVKAANVAGQGRRRPCITRFSRSPSSLSKTRLPRPRR